MGQSRGGLALLATVFLDPQSDRAETRVGVGGAGRRAAVGQRIDPRAPGCSVTTSDLPSSTSTAVPLLGGWVEAPGPPWLAAPRAVVQASPEEDTLPGAEQSSLGPAESPEPVLGGNQTTRVQQPPTGAPRSSSFSQGDSPSSARCN